MIWGSLLEGSGMAFDQIIAPPSSPLWMQRRHWPMPLLIVHTANQMDFDHGLLQRPLAK
jgi:hypothetical protein